MGEIAEDIYEGACCALCGQYFIQKDKEEFIYVHGFPVACNECYDEDCGYGQQDNKYCKLL